MLGKTYCHSVISVELKRSSRLRPASFDVYEDKPSEELKTALFEEACMYIYYYMLASALASLIAKWFIKMGWNNNSKVYVSSFITIFNPYSSSS